MASSNYPNFPDISEVLCSESRMSLKEATDIYRKTLISEGFAEYANKLLAYEKGIPKKSDYDQFINHMRAWKKKKKYNFEIYFTRRKKSFIKYNEKIRLFIMNFDKAKTDEERRKYALDNICDIFGIRIVLDLGKEDTAESIRICYEVLNEIISFFVVKKGYTPTVAEPLIFTGFSAEEHPDVFVPSESAIMDGYEINVKDYYKNPKKNGYQSLHIVFRSPLGFPMEIQLRTLATHIRVEYGEAASHFAHDRERYSERIDIDPKKVNISGFRYIDENKIFDGAGIFSATDPFAKV